MSTDDLSTDDGDAPRQADGGSRSPRWREGDDIQRDVERARRLRGSRAPDQRGAIDEERSVDPAAGSPSEERSDRA
jgi:hypothetical protein